MASLISKKKKNKLYYYVVESARVNGQPRIVHQTYLGSAQSGPSYASPVRPDFPHSIPPVAYATPLAGVYCERDHT